MEERFERDPFLLEETLGRQVVGAHHFDDGGVRVRKRLNVKHKSARLVLSEPETQLGAPMKFL